MYSSILCLPACHHQHYASYFRKDGLWFLLDDTLVKEVGPEWQQVKQKCIANRSQPAMLFYVKEEPSAHTHRCPLFVRELVCVH